jgi:hypothetical protein
MKRLHGRVVVEESDVKSVLQGGGKLSQLRLSE